MDGPWLHDDGSAVRVTNSIPPGPRLQPICLAAPTEIVAQTKMSVAVAADPRRGMRVV